MREELSNFIGPVSLVSLFIFLYIEWQIPGFVSTVIPIYWLLGAVLLIILAVKDYLSIGPLYVLCFLLFFVILKDGALFGILQWPFAVAVLVLPFLMNKLLNQLMLNKIMTDCLFCRIVKGEVPCEKIYENDHVLAFLDIGPVSKGHTLVIPKNHSQDLAAGSIEDSLELMKAIHELAPKISASLGASAYNLGMNHGIDAGQEVLHTHIHIMPRYNGQDRTFVKTHPPREELAKLGEELRAKLGK